ncbi:DISARM system phospholipase D-like protein DrmC [Glycomyces sp. NPDC021274]|uniref:DISARM system phospholipase D-like protein DrmC n=1 Tax=Glycomyces sp. NPDC021274 TaxID=3155120 RepID=UPI003406C047
MGVIRPREAVHLYAIELLDLVGPHTIISNINDIVAAEHPAMLAERLGHPEAAELLGKLCNACRELGEQRALDFLHGFFAGLLNWPRAAEVVWTGPTVPGVPVRSTWRALLSVLVAAEQELWLTTYSAKPYPPMLEQLQRRIAHGVTVNIAVETLAGAGSAISGSEPAAAFATVTGAKLYTWDRATRPEDARLHAKLALADDQLLLSTSANFTTSGIEKNLEAGLLISGGPAPKRTAEHLRGLVRNGQLVRI